MYKQENSKHSVTWEMIAEKLDKEILDLISYAPRDTAPALLSYFKVAAIHIYRWLKDHSVPEDLHGAIYKRDKTLAHIAHHWLDEAVRRGGDTMDKDDIAAISVGKWLEQVRQEENTFDTGQPQAARLPEFAQDNSLNCDEEPDDWMEQ